MLYQTNLKNYAKPLFIVFLHIIFINICTFRIKVVPLQSKVEPKYIITNYYDSTCSVFFGKYWLSTYEVPMNSLYLQVVDKGHTKRVISYE